MEALESDMLVTLPGPCYSLVQPLTAPPSIWISLATSAVSVGALKYMISRKNFRNDLLCYEI